MMVWVDGCMDGVDECVDGWDEGLEGMRVWRAILLQWGAEFSKAPMAIMTLACPPPQRDTRWSPGSQALYEGREGPSRRKASHREVLSLW